MFNSEVSHRLDIPKCEWCQEDMFTPCTKGESEDCALRKCLERDLPDPMSEYKGEPDIECGWCGEMVHAPCNKGESVSCSLRTCIQERNREQPPGMELSAGMGVLLDVPKPDATFHPKVGWGKALDAEVILGYKPTNPKDAVGIKKMPLSVLSGPVLAEVALGCMEGALKYGRHNWRKAGIRFSVYYDATIRHLMQWWEGEDIDEDSGLSHITKAICSLMVLRDAMIFGMANDDRPPKSPHDWMTDMNRLADQLVEKYPNPLPAITEASDGNV